MGNKDERPWSCRTGGEANRHLKILLINLLTLLATLVGTPDGGATSLVNNGSIPLMT
jgi:hypothetical protein